MKKRILFVYAPAGPPLDYCMPKLANHGEITTCIISPPSLYNHKILTKYSSKIFDLTQINHSLVFNKIRKILMEGYYNAILTFSEFILSEVSEIASDFGLRGVGPNVDFARNKILMRQRWAEFSLPQPKFIAINNVDDLNKVKVELTPPFIIKVAYGAGSIGQQVVKDLGTFDDAIKLLLEAVEKARDTGKHEYTELDGFPKLIAEEIINSSTNSWYDINGFGDYLSVEGLVKDGIYYPIAITGRLPTVEPFTELCNFAPCLLKNEKKKKIVDLATKAINALSLENAATHTEFKLMENGELNLLETSARMGGVAIANELEIAFSIDYIDLFIKVILGEEIELPKFESTPTGKAAASVAIIAVDTKGQAWDRKHIFSPEDVDWNSLTKNNINIDIQWSQSLPPNSDIPPYNIADGVMNYAGQVLVSAEDPILLKENVYQILDNIQFFMPLK